MRTAILAMLAILATACADNQRQPDAQPKAWIPANAEVPAAVANRSVLPWCGTSTSDVPPPMIACIAGAHANGGSAELVLDQTIETSRAIQIVRVLSRGHVEIIYGTHPQGFPWLWEIALCDGIKAADNRLGLVQGKCAPATELR